MKSEEVLLRELLVEEEKAVADYVNVADKIKNESIKKVLLDIAEEEKVHKGELIRCLKEIGVHDKFAIHKGEEEVNHMLLKQGLMKVQDMLNDIAFRHGEEVPDKVIIVPQEKEEAQDANIIPHKIQ